MADQILSREEVEHIFRARMDSLSDEDTITMLRHDADLRAQVAGLEAGIARAPHSAMCRKHQCECENLISNRQVCAKCECNCYLSALSGPIARGRELLAAEQYMRDLEVINPKMAARVKVAATEELKRLKGESK